MRLKVSKSKNAASLYVIKSVYNPETQSNTSKIVEKLGTEAELKEKLNGQDPYEWAKEYITKLNALEKKRTLKSSLSSLNQRKFLRTSKYILMVATCFSKIFTMNLGSIKSVKQSLKNINFPMI